MASRLDMSKYAKELEEEVKQEEEDAGREKFSALRPVVTPEIVDEAVNNVLARTSYPPEVKETFRKLLASDPNTGFASSFHLGKAEAHYEASHPKLSKRVVRVPYVCNAPETSDIVEYAPELDIKFMDEENHDHPAPAAFRLIDFELIMSVVSKGDTVKDIGGNPIYHINRESANLRVCTPIVDRKDPSRAVMRDMRARKIAADTTRSVKARKLASAFLERDKTFVCGHTAVECDCKAKVTIAGHVYDIPMEQWPQIMDKAGALVHYGVVLFPKTTYTESHGVMAKARARYEVDYETGRFRMGFIGSASWWYDHKWLDYMRYGTDQLIVWEGKKYSYKVYERRGDSVFYQIMRVPFSEFLDTQWFRLPGVPMVRVDGFEYVGGAKKASVLGRTPLRPKVYWFPQGLWEDMLQQASMEFERGVMTYDRLYNYYRVVSPRNTINGVLTSGGQSVPMDQLVALVTHVGMCAATTVMLGQRTSRVVTSAAMAARAGSGGMFAASARAFWTSVNAAARVLSYYPLMWLSDRFATWFGTVTGAALVEWSYEPAIKEVPFSSLVGDGKMASLADWKWESGFEAGLLEGYVSTARAEHLRAIAAAPALASLITEVCADALSGEELEAITVATSEASATLVGQPSEVEDVDEVAYRKRAIMECISESEMENAKLVEVCERIFRECTDGAGQPVVDLMQTRAEEFYNVDFWLVRAGVLVSSALGLDALECRHSALYTLRVDQSSGSRFRTVKEDTYDPAEVGRRGPVVEYRVLTDRSFSGWAMSIDRLLIYNGPEIQATLREALKLDHKYKVVLMQGPPGCGKTYQMKEAYVDGDMAMCPVRESAYDTRKALGEKRPMPTRLRDRCRTSDSYLTNYASTKVRELRAGAVHADECYMAKAGIWYACAALLRANVVYAYGDIKQIPHVPRVQARNEYGRIKGNSEVVKHDTWRCPADAVAAWAHIYDYRTRTRSTIMKSMVICESYQGLDIPQRCVMLTMYQADKREVQRLFKTRKDKQLRIMTVHESEGKTFDDVWLFRFDVRPRTDDTSLFDKDAYCLVAMSRHRKTFKYIRPRNLGDLVDKWYVNALDPRAVAAAADMSTLGKSVQFK